MHKTLTSFVWFSPKLAQIMFRQFWQKDFWWTESFSQSVLMHLMKFMQKCTWGYIFAMSEEPPTGQKILKISRFSLKCLFIISEQFDQIS